MGQRLTIAGCSRLKRLALSYMSLAAIATPFGENGSSLFLECELPAINAKFERSRYRIFNDLAFDYVRNH